MCVQAMGKMLHRRIISSWNQWRDFVKEAQQDRQKLHVSILPLC